MWTFDRPRHCSMYLKISEGRAINTALCSVNGRTHINTRTRGSRSVSKRQNEVPKYFYCHSSCYFWRLWSSLAKRTSLLLPENCYWLRHHSSQHFIILLRLFKGAVSFVHVVQYTRNWKYVESDDWVLLQGTILAFGWTDFGKHKKKNLREESLLATGLPHKCL